MGVKLEQTQLKGFATDGTLLFTRNLGAPDTSALLAHAAGLQPGGRLQAQAVISGADVARVGVVTVDDVVRRLPDLGMAQVTIPMRAAINTARSASWPFRFLRFSMYRGGDQGFAAAGRQTVTVLAVRQDRRTS